MVRIQIKPLTVNQSYQGRRFATPALTSYKNALYVLLPKMDVPKGKLKVHYIFGVSSKNSDVDNCCKAFQDALSEKYGFNDRMIYEMKIEKTDVPKGKEYCSFSIEAI